MELLRCKIHRIYSVRTDISPNGDMCALRGVLQTARHKKPVAYGGRVPPSLQRTQLPLSLRVFSIISIHQSVWKSMYQGWRYNGT